MFIISFKNSKCRKKMTFADCQVSNLIYPTTYPLNIYALKLFWLGGAYNIYILCKSFSNGNTRFFSSSIISCHNLAPAGFVLTGLISVSRACKKSARVMHNFSKAWGSTSTLLVALIRRFIAHDWAALTKPSSSAPLKFLVKAANSWNLEDKMWKFLEVM